MIDIMHYITRMESRDPDENIPSKDVRHILKCYLEYHWKFTKPCNYIVVVITWKCVATEKERMSL